MNQQTQLLAAIDRALGLELYTASEVIILSVHPSNFLIMESTPNAAKFFGYSIIEGLYIGDLVPDSIIKPTLHNNLMRSFSRTAQQGHIDKSQQMANRVLTAQCCDGTQISIIAILSYKKVRDADRIIVTIFQHD